MATGVSTTKWNGERQSVERTAAGDDLFVTLSYAGKKSAEEILSGPCAQTFNVWGVADDSAKSVNRLYWGDNLPILRMLLNKVPPEAKCSALSDLAKRAVDPAIKAASLAMLAKAGGAM